MALWERSGTLSALLTVDEETAATTCIFGDPDSMPLLGAVTLEECGLAVDPVRKRLVPVVGLLAAQPVLQAPPSSSSRPAHPGPAR